HERGIVIGFVAVAWLFVSPLYSIDRLHIPALGMIFRIGEHTIEQIRIMVNDLLNAITVKVNRLEVLFVFCHIPNTIGTLKERQCFLSFSRHYPGIILRVI
ncbi:hypothetical protein RZS08_36215, partial [Arthrospira platensis SPKY1]|nr:hypothetical protein [Arthrospira platensis SPKY1]